MILGGGEWSDRFFGLLSMLLRFKRHNLKDYGTGLGTGVQGKVTEVLDVAPEAQDDGPEA